MVADGGETTASVRLTRLDASDVASTTGEYLGITSGRVIVLAGVTLKALDYDGTTTTLGRVTPPSDVTNPRLVVSPDLSQWLYVTASDSQSRDAQVHLGSATSDRVITTLKSPDGNGIYGPFAWNASGIYFVLNAVGLGGYGPFLEYHFPVTRFDLSTAALTPITPSCTVYAVLDSGTLVCANSEALSQGAGLEIRPPGKAANRVLVAPSTALADVTISADGTTGALARNGGSASSAWYQTMTFAIGSAPQPFGPRDYVPNAWLPDGRLVATHACIDATDFHGAACDTSKNGTYILSANGSGSVLYFKWPQDSNASVVAALP